MPNDRRALLLPATLFLAICAPPQAAGQLAACAERLAESMRAEHGIPALAVAVLQDNALVLNHADGAAHVEFGIPATPSTVFQLSSTSRVFTGVLAMRMAAEGRVDLDRPVTAYLVGAPAGWDSITLRHLLTNTVGLPDVLAVEREIAGPATPDALMAELYRRAPAPEPEVRWAYGLGDYFVAQHLLERVGDAPFDELMEREVFRPAGMTGARYWSSDRDVVIGAATGYYPDTTRAPLAYEQREFDFPAHLFAAGGVAASLEDMIRYARALQDGRLLAPDARDRMWEDVRLQNGRVVSYGLGWDTKTHAPGRRSAGHSGGFLTTLRIYPDAELTAIVLMNGFLQPVNPDDVATAFAAVWDPSLVGLTEPACRVADLAEAQF